MDIGPLTTSGALGIVAAMMLSAPTALADPPPPIPAPAPAPAPAAPLIPAAAPAAAPLDPAIPTPGPPPGPAPDGTVQAAAADPAAPPQGVPHLSSLENLPPGTTDTPVDANQPRSLTYLRDLWHAVQTQDVSGRDALLLLTQRPMDANAAPPPGMSPNPTPPLPPEPAPAPAPPLLP
jgi:resuscitation-promoting factor RpfA